MTQEQKELLLKDLCARLPYGTKIEHEGNISELDVIFICDSISISSTSMDKKLSYNLDLDEIKPYLFPLSSMTEEQLFEVQEILGKNEIKIEDGFLRIVDSDRNTISYLEIHALLNWFYKNHFDICGLIPMDLAIDATGKNIY